MTKRNSMMPLVTAAALAVCLAPFGGANAADFYAGKTLAIAVGSNAGGGYDTYTRLLARHLQKHIPGAPTVVVQDEPGGGGLRAAQDIYAVAPKDGTKIGNFRASNMLDAILGIRGKQIDPNKYEWIGNMTTDTDVCSFWKTAGVHSFADLKKKQVLVGGSGPSSQGYIFPTAIDHVLHTKMKVILGYKGTADRIVAMEQGELQGACGMNGSTITSLYPKEIASGKLIPIMQSGLHPYPALPKVPLTQSFATTPSQKHILVTVFSQMEIARFFAAPPGTPKDRVAILRKAFMQTMHDPALIADAKKMRLALHPMSGEEVAKIIARMSDLSPKLKAQVRAAIGG